MSLWFPLQPEVDRNNIPESHMFPRGYAGAPPREKAVPSSTAGTEEPGAAPLTTPGEFGGSRADFPLFGVTMSALDDYRDIQKVPELDEI